MVVIFPIVSLALCTSFIHFIHLPFSFKTCCMHMLHILCCTSNQNLFSLSSFPQLNPAFTILSFPFVLSRYAVNRLSIPVLCTPSYTLVLLSSLSILVYNFWNHSFSSHHFDLHIHIIVTLIVLMSQKICVSFFYWLNQEWLTPISRKFWNTIMGMGIKLLHTNPNVYNWS